jgi:hypothetical protein
VKYWDGILLTIAIIFIICGACGVVVAFTG